MSGGCTERYAQSEDIYGVHGAICPIGGERVRVHNKIRDLVGYQAKKAVFEVDYEVRYGKPPSKQELASLKEGDQFIWVDGEKIVLQNNRAGDVV